NLADSGAASTTFRMSDASATVRANYEDVKYDLFVEYGGIEPSGVNAGQFIMGERISLLALHPAAHEYRFDGWTSDSGGVFDDPADEATDFTMPAGSAVVTAHWTPLYRLAVEDGVISTPASGTEGYFEAGDVIEVTSNTAPTGYSFIGWYSNNGGSFDAAAAVTTTFTMPSNDVTITAQYIYTVPATTYTLTVEDGVTTNVTSGISPGASIPISASVPGGHYFTGWVARPTEGGVERADGSREPNLNYGSFADASLVSTTFIMPDQNITVTAILVDAQYTLTVTDGYDSSPLPETGPYHEGDNVAISAPPHTGQIFTGWVITAGGDLLANVANADITNTTFIMPGANAAISATYAAVEDTFYTLTTVDCHSDEPGPFKQGDSDTVIVTADVPSGKRLVSWDTGGVGYTPSGTQEITFTMPDRNVTVTAHYRDAPPSGGTTHDVDEFGGDGWGQGGTPTPGSGGDKQEKTSDTAETDSHKAYVRGIGNDLFDPEGGMTRAYVAQIFFNLLPDNDVEAAARFPDVPDGAWYAEAVNTLASLDIVVGYPDGKYYPDTEISWAQMIYFAVLFAKETSDGGPAPRLVNVPANHWAYEQMAIAEHLGWLIDVDGAELQPERVITRAEVVTLLNRVFDRSPDKSYIDGHPDLIRFKDVPETHPAYYEIMEAANTHIYIRHGEYEEWV
ncbi:MAG: S-layer homology domain-containing protein, partial [Oscillospiraceae bacterium]|nr:S-layer homology domain-containing protein [Oscillospiraceae bacterium]